MCKLTTVRDSAKNQDVILNSSDQRSVVHEVVNKPYIHTVCKCELTMITHYSRLSLRFSTVD